MLDTPMKTALRTLDESLDRASPDALRELRRYFRCWEAWIEERLMADPPTGTHRIPVD